MKIRITPTAIWLICSFPFFSFGYAGTPFTFLKDVIEENSSSINLQLPCYVIKYQLCSTEKEAKNELVFLQNAGYEAGYLWIPDYESLSGRHLFLVFIGPFPTKSVCEFYLKDVQASYPDTYGLLIAHTNRRIIIEKPGKIEYINQDFQSIPGIFPLGSGKKISVKELSHITKYEISAMKNEILARHGYIFQSDCQTIDIIREQNWYTPTYPNVDNLLSDIEKHNLLILESMLVARPDN